MTAFYEHVIQNFIDNINNDYFDNYDADRFGPKPKEKQPVIKNELKKRFFRDRISKVDLKYYLPKFLIELKSIEPGLDFFYDSLSDNESKKWFVDLICFRILGNKKIKLQVKHPEDKKILHRIKAVENINDSIDPNFLHFKLNKFDLNPLGKNVKLYFMAQGILIDFFLEQYRYNKNGVGICAKENDVVIDAGGCWGDTALYFADRVGEKGKVFSFEFIPNNLSIFQKNLDLNPRFQNKIEIVNKPLSDISGKKIYYKDLGPGSKVEFENFQEADGSTETISIDDFVSTNDVPKIDFIKMDIEGSELPALKGAIQVIKKYKPQLAIAIYHSWDDFINIPKWILDLNLGYKIYLGHYTIHAEETVIYATVK